MDTQHIIEILIMCLLGVVGFIGVRVHSALDNIYLKLDSMEGELNVKCNEVHKRLSGHDVKFARCPNIK